MHLQKTFRQARYALTFIFSAFIISQNVYADVYDDDF